MDVFDMEFETKEQLVATQEETDTLRQENKLLVQFLQAFDKWRMSKKMEIPIAAVRGSTVEMRAMEMESAFKRVEYLL